MTTSTTTNGAEEIAEQVVLSEFVGCVVVLHSYRYSPFGMRAKRGGPEGEVDAQLIVLTGDRFGLETAVYIEDEDLVSTIREQLLGDFDGPLYGRVERDEEDSEILFLAMSPIEESMYRAIVTVVPV